MFFLVTLYPRFWSHMTEIFEVSMWIYVGLFFIESFTLYVYYYGWDRLKYGGGKWLHFTLGVLLNVWGTDRDVHCRQLAQLHDEPAGRASHPIRRPAW